MQGSSRHSWLHELTPSHKGFVPMLSRWSVGLPRSQCHGHMFSGHIFVMVVLTHQGFFGLHVICYSSMLWATFDALQWCGFFYQTLEFSYVVACIIIVTIPASISGALELCEMLISRQIAWMHGLLHGNCTAWCTYT